MRAGLAGDVDAAGPGGGDEPGAAAGGDMDDVERAAGVLGEHDRAADRLELGDHRPASPGSRASRDRSARARSPSVIAALSACTATGSPSRAASTIPS